MKTIFAVLSVIALSCAALAQTHTEVTIEDVQTITAAKTFGGGATINGGLTLGTPLGVPNGGSGTASTLTGIIRGGNPFTGTELSGDARTSGSNAVTVVQAHWTAASIINAQSPYSVALGDVFLSCNAVGGNIVFTLPAATGTGRAIFFKKTDASANTCTVNRAGGDTIDGQTSVVLTAQYQSVPITDSATGVWSVGNSPSGGVVSGGTGLSSGTSGGILGFTATTTIASSGLLNNNVLVSGGGAGATPKNSNITDNGVGVTVTEGAAPPGVGGADLLYADSTAHRWKVNNNNGGATTAALFTDNLGVFATGGTVTPALYASLTNCQLGGAAGTTSPAACGAAPSGAIAVPASQVSYVVNTTAVTANSHIIVQQITDNSGLPSGPTCNAGATIPIQSARVANTSFTITQTSVASVTCFQYWIVN